MIPHGTRVTLTNAVYGTKEIGTLHDPNREYPYCRTKTIRLDDGRLYRTEGTIERA